MSYVIFNTGLNLYSKKKSLVSNQCISTYLSFVAFGMLILSECEKEQIVMFIIGINPNIGNIIELSLKFINGVTRTTLVTNYSYYFVK